LVGFRVRGKQKKVVLSGIGSHSQMLQDNASRLKGLGWLGSGDEWVASIESDFSGWNKFTVESGEPTPADLRLLKCEYKRVAGSAKALIAHVKRTGKIDHALVDLLTAPAWAEYDKVRDAAWAEYDKVRAAARAEYGEVRAAAWAGYGEVKAAAWAEYDKVRAAAWAEYGEVIVPAWCKLFAVKANRIKRLR
jgi:predicted aminopeptidase